MEKKPLIILTGPTSVGKSALSIALAKVVGGEVISADSMQVYRHMDIGTAKLTRSEMQGVPHYLIDEMEPDEEFNVVRFQQLAKRYMDQIYSRNRIPILVGGTGFYIQAVLYDIDFHDYDSGASYRSDLEQLLRERGEDYLYGMLKEADPESAEIIHPHNTKRVIHALEFVKMTGMRISEHNKKQKEKESPYHYCYFVLNRDRSSLYRSINERVDKMLQEGLLDEVKALTAMGYTRDLVSMQGLGYKEMMAYLEGKCSFEDAVEILKRDTRHYAKRQLTWFRREKDVIWVDKDQFESEEELLKHLLRILEEKSILPHMYQI